MSGFYTVKRTTEPADITAEFGVGAWNNAEVMTLKERPSDEKHRIRANSFAPEVSLRMLYDDTTIYGQFEVKDRYVIVTHYGYQQNVCFDSCVELFIRPQGNKRYYNFEMSGGGAMLLYNITALRAGVYSKIPVEDCMTIQRFHTLPTRVKPEIKKPVTWRLGFAIPIAFFVKYGDHVNPRLSGQTWHGNVMKCAENSSHPHWLTWQPLTKVDFHLPECFGEFRYE